MQRIVSLKGNTPAEMGCPLERRDACCHVFLSPPGRVVTEGVPGEQPSRQDDGGQQCGGVRSESKDSAHCSSPVFVLLILAVRSSVTLSFQSSTTMQATGGPGRPPMGVVCQQGQEGHYNSFGNSNMVLHQKGKDSNKLFVCLKSLTQSWASAALKTV